MTQETQPNLFTQKEAMSTTEAQPKAKKRQLSVAVQAKLIDWLRANVERIEAADTALAVAKLATADLSIDIGESSIRTTMAALGMGLPKPKQPMNVEQAIELLAREILAVKSRQGGFMISPELLALAGMEA